MEKKGASLNSDEFVSLVRKGSDKLRVDELVLFAAGKELHGKGMLRILEDDIELDMTLAADEIAPPLTVGFFTAKDAWTLKGLIEDHLGFECKQVFRYSKSSCLRRFWVHGVFFH